MPWWNRLLGEPGPDEAGEAVGDFADLEAELAQPRPLVGEARLGAGCASAGCAQEVGWPCAYEDHTGEACPTHWCRAHLTLLEGRAYCADHAATVRALAARPAAAPALANRSPALTEWLGRRLDPAILAALEECRDQFAEAIASDPVVAGEGDGLRRWSRAWRLFDGAVDTLRVAIDVGEDEPPTVRALVGATTLAQARCPASGSGREGVAVLLEDALRAGIAVSRPRPGPPAG